jgi:hypothetical protein
VVSSGYRTEKEGEVMAKRVESVFRVVESIEPLPTGRPARRVPAMPGRRGPTQAEALQALQATPAARAVIKQVPGLERPEVWGERAYWAATADFNGLNSEGGAARGEVFLWNCDFPGFLWDMFTANANRIAYFSGADDLGDLLGTGEIVPPETLNGQVWCYMDLAEPGHYLFVAQVETYPEQYFSPDYVAVIECSIDSASFGTRTLSPGPAVNEVFLANLSAGPHRFQIKQISGGLFFYSLTAWAIPVVATQ